MSPSSQVVQTPLPWKFHEDTRMIESEMPSLRGEFEHVCDFRADLGGKVNEANAAFIVRACNSHDELANTLRRLAEKVKRANAIQHSGGDVSPEDWSELYALQNEAFGVLAKATGQT